MPRYLITLPDDPTLAAQAHAAILAVPGVVGVGGGRTLRGRRPRHGEPQQDGRRA